MLKIQGLNTHYGAIHALKGIDLEIHKGEVVSLIGSNGAGKSTLLNSIAGNIDVDSGRIYNNGRDITYEKEYKRARYIGRLYQDPLKGTAPHMTIEENLGLAFSRGKRMRLGFGVRKSDRVYFKEVCKKLGLGLETRLTSEVGLLSGGQRQALTLLMATLETPELLLLDEHTAALDPKTAAKVLELTQQIVAEDQLTTLMITHNMKDALRYGNRLIMLHEGRILFDVPQEKKEGLTTRDLLSMFEQAAGSELASDSLLLS